MRSSHARKIRRAIHDCRSGKRPLVWVGLYARARREYRRRESIRAARVLGRLLGRMLFPVRRGGER